MSESFRAILVTRNEDKSQSVDVVDMTGDELMEGDVTVAVEATTVNYKDGLAVTGKSPVIRRFPMIPGIDFAGTVTASDHADWHPGDKVVLNGCDGRRHGGLYRDALRHGAGTPRHIAGARPGGGHRRGWRRRLGRRRGVGEARLSRHRLHRP
jgi:acrylyl-CoA reductase (NADPH)